MENSKQRKLVAVGVPSLLIEEIKEASNAAESKIAIPTLTLLLAFYKRILFIGYVCNAPWMAPENSEEGKAIAHRVFDKVKIDGKGYEEIKETWNDEYAMIVKEIHKRNEDREKEVDLTVSHVPYIAAACVVLANEDLKKAEELMSEIMTALNEEIDVKLDELERQRRRDDLTLLN